MERTKIATIAAAPWMLTLAAVVVLAACDQGFHSVSDQSLSEQSAEATSGSLRISVGSLQGLSLLPDISMDPVRYQISGSGPGDESFAVSFDYGSASAAVVDNLAVGDWAVTVDAFNATGDRIGSGSGNANVSAGLVQGLTIEVKPLPGPGTLDLEVNWEEEVLAEPKISAKLIGSDQSETKLEFALAQSNRAQFESEAINAGYYTLALQLLDGETVVGGAVEAVRVAQDARTSGSFEFDHISVPSGDVDIVITPELDDPLRVSIAGVPESVALGEELSVSASTDNAGGEDVFYSWFLNGAPAGSGEAIELGGLAASGTYRLDVVAFTSGGRRAGSATHTFTVQDEPESEIGGDGFPPFIVASLWDTIEVRDEAPEGRRRVSIDPAARVPEGFELRFYSGPADGGATELYNRILEPGEIFTTVGSMAVGSTCHNVLFWRRTADGAWRQASENQITFQIQGLESVSMPPGGEGPLAPTAAMLSQAAAMPHPIYEETGRGTRNNGWNGAHPLTLALGEAAGDTTYRTTLINRLKYVVNSGTEPAAKGGYPSQHEMNAYAAAAVSRHLPIWNELTSAEQAKWDTVMLAGLVANAFVSSDNNPYIVAGTQQRDLKGGTNLSRTWNPNFRASFVGNVLIAMTYFGGPSATEELLNSFNLDDFVARADSQGLNFIRNTYTRQWPDGPTASQIRDAVSGYEYWGRRLSQYRDIVKLEVEDTFSRTVARGLNDGAGIDGCGTTIVNATPPNDGALGMAKEFDSWDASGKRADLGYAIGGYRNTLQTILVLAATGYWDANGALEGEVIARMSIGATDLIWKQQVAGYRSYSHGGCRKVWNPDDSTDNSNYGLVYTWGLWTDVLKPYHGL